MKIEIFSTAYYNTIINLFHSVTICAKQGHFKCDDNIESPLARGTHWNSIYLILRWKDVQLARVVGNELLFVVRLFNSSYIFRKLRYEMYPISIQHTLTLLISYDVYN